MVKVAVPDAVEVATGAAGVLGGATCGVAEAEAEDAGVVYAPAVAVCVKVYAVPFARPLITHEVAGETTVQVAPPGDAVNVYEVAPVTEATVTVALPLLATALGAPEAASGVTDVEAADAVEVRLEPVAVAVNEYAIPLVRPVNVQVVAGAVTVQVMPPGDDVTV